MELKIWLKFFLYNIIFSVIVFDFKAFDFQLSQPTNTIAVAVKLCKNICLWEVYCDYPVTGRICWFNFNQNESWDNPLMHINNRETTWVYVQWIIHHLTTLLMLLQLWNFTTHHVYVLGFSKNIPMFIIDFM